jgi:DNA-binding CsgD family transcriptional regulator
MDRKSVERLTEQQRICLRHVYAHKTSKEIAPLLGIEPGSVDQHIKAAMRILGVTDRRSAACLLAEHENPALRPLVYQSPELARPGDPATLGPPIESGRQLSSRWPGEAMREEQASFRLVTPGGAPTFPFSVGNRRPGDLSWIARLGWVAAITIGVAVAFGGLISALEGLSALAGH